MWDENRSVSGAPERQPPAGKPAPLPELGCTGRPALKELNAPVQPRPPIHQQMMMNKPAAQLQTVAKPGSPSRFDAVRALDEDENWRERTEVITKHDHQLNRQLARDIVEQIVDSAASTPTESSSLSFATVSSNPPAAGPLPGALPDLVRGTSRAAAAQDTDSGDSEYESASDHEEVPAAPPGLRSETSLLADELLGLCLQTPLKRPSVVQQPAGPQPPPQQARPLLDLSLTECRQEGGTEEGEKGESGAAEVEEKTEKTEELVSAAEGLVCVAEELTSGAAETAPSAGGLVPPQPPAAATAESQSPEEPSPGAQPAVVPGEAASCSEEATPVPGGPAAATEQSTAVTEQSAAVTEQSAAATEQSAAATEQSAAATEQPAAATEQSAATTEQPSAGSGELGGVKEEAVAGGDGATTAETACDGEIGSAGTGAASATVRSASPPIRAASPPIRAAFPPVRSASPPIRSASPPVRSASSPIRAASPPVRSASPPIRSASPPIRAASPPIRSASPPIRSGSPPIRAASPPIRSASPPIRAASPPIRSASPPIRAASPPIRSSSPPIRSASPPIRAADPAMTQTGDEDEPIPPKVGYNLDFLDDPNFNPFATGSGVQLSPPGSPKAGLPPLKAAKTKKQREAAAAETNGVNGCEDGAVEKGEKGEENGQSEEPVKPPARKPVKKPVRPVKRLVKKKPVPPPPEPDPAEENGRPDSPPLAPPPAKGYNLDFLDHCDDPNFNPFATKAAVTNSPSGSPTAGRKVTNSPPLPARSAAKKQTAKPAVKAEPETEPEPQPEPEPEPAGSQEERVPAPVLEPEPEPEPAEPEPVSAGRPDPQGGGDASVSLRSDASRTALLDTAPLDFGEVTAGTSTDQEMACASSDQFVEATNFFQDPAALDRLAEHGDGRLAPAIARNSLYVKFDPLLGRPSVLPEIQRLAGGAEEPTAAVPRQLTSVKSDLIAFSPGKEPAEPAPPPPAAPAAAPAPAERRSATPPPSAPPDSTISQLLKKQELYFQDQLLKRDREMTAMKNANAKLIQQASNGKTEQVLEGVMHLLAMINNENVQLRREMQTSLPRLAAERDEARQEVANAEAMFADLHRKYEKSKAVLQEHRRSAEKSDASCREAREMAGRERQRYDMLQQHAEEAHTRLQTELESAQKTHQAELLTLRAKLQLAENREAKLERENREITAICDELIQKMGGAR